MPSVMKCRPPESCRHRSRRKTTCGGPAFRRVLGELRERRAPNAALREAILHAQGSRADCHRGLPPPRTGKGGHHDDKRTVLWSDFLEYAAEFVHLRRGGVVLIIEGNQQSDYLTFGAFHGNAQLVTERRCQNIFVTREADATRRGLFGDLQLCDERGDEVSRSNVNMNSCPVKVPSCSFRNLLENDNLSDAPRIDKEERSRRAAIVGGNSQRLPGGVVWHCVQLKTGHLAGKRSVWVGWGAMVEGREFNMVPYITVDGLSTVPRGRIRRRRHLVRSRIWHVRNLPGYECPRGSGCIVHSGPVPFLLICSTS